MTLSNICYCEGLFTPSECVSKREIDQTLSKTDQRINDKH